MSVILVAFVMEGCGHCVKFKNDVWPSLSNKIDNAMMVDADDEVTEKAGIEAFPTIWFLSPESTHEYTGPRNVQSILCALREFQKMLMTS